MTTGNLSFAAKQQAMGRRVLSQAQAAYTIDETGAGVKSVPIRNKRDGRVVWIKEEDVFYYLSPIAKPLVPGDRRADGECLFERITREEAAKPKKIIAQPAGPVGLNVRPDMHPRKARKRKRGRRG